MTERSELDDHMKIYLTLCSLACGFSVQCYGATLEKYPESLDTALRQYMETIQPQNQPLHGYTFDYRYARVSDLKVSSTLALESVLQTIRKKTQEAGSFSNLSLVLSENYITDTGFKMLIDFLLDAANIDLLSSIINIDLRNNRITAESAQNIKMLLDKSPKLQLDLSINYISPKDIPSGVSSRVNCKAL